MPNGILALRAQPQGAPLLSGRFFATLFSVSARTDKQTVGQGGDSILCEESVYTSISHNMILTTRAEIAENISQTRTLTRNNKLAKLRIQYYFQVAETKYCTGILDFNWVWTLNIT